MARGPARPSPQGIHGTIGGGISSVRRIALSIVDEQHRDEQHTITSTSATSSALLMHPSCALVQIRLPPANGGVKSCQRPLR